MKHIFQGLTFETPDDYGFDEAMLTLRSTAADELKEPMMLQKQWPVRSNLIIHRRVVHEDATLELLAGEICAELVSSVAGMENLAMERFPFADGAEGMIIAFDFALTKKVNAAVRQYQALRLDDQRLTSLTLTVDRNKMTERGKADVLELLGSAAPVTQT